MTTETMSNEGLAQRPFEPHAPPSGLWGILSSMGQSFRMAVELNSKLQSLPVKEQVDFARRFIEKRTSAVSLCETGAL